MKYCFKEVDGIFIDYIVEDSWCCIVKVLVFVEKDMVKWEFKFYDVLEDFKYLLVGWIMVGVGMVWLVMLFNCFVMGIVLDLMGGIFDMFKEVVLIMQQGGGIGYDFLIICFKGVLVKGVVVDVLGLLLFMDVWDVMCWIIMLVGLCCGVMMVIMCCDYFDIESFIIVKFDFVCLCMFNMLVLVIDLFMEVVKLNGNWDLVFEGKVYKMVKVFDLWNQIMQLIYDFVELGVIFIDCINEMNNFNYVEIIVVINFCGE